MPTERELRQRARADYEQPYRPAPIDPKWTQLPTSQNIEDRRAEPFDLANHLLYPTGYTAEEWATMLRHPLTPTTESLPRFKPEPPPPDRTDDPLSDAAGFNSIRKLRIGRQSYDR